MITKRQINRVERIIKADCQLVGQNICDGKTCIVGALALAAGMSPASLDRLSRKASDQIINNNDLAAVARRIRSKFGLDVDQLRAMQEANDGVEESVPKRRRAVLSAFRGLVRDAIKAAKGK